jgi:leishmanolysin-like peptidase
LEKREVTCVDGNMRRLAPPSSNTLKAGYTNRGKLFYEIVTPTVRQVVRNQFNCQQMGGARIENQPTNDGNCFGSHWEARLFASDVIAAIKIPTLQFLTPLTLALFDDSGWYISDFSVASVSPFGHGRGCDFVFEDCIVDGEVSEWGKGIFCNDLEGSFMEQRCDLNHKYITRCDLVDFANYPGAVPPDRKHQYFPDNPVS